MDAKNPLVVQSHPSHEWMNEYQNTATSLTTQWHFSQAPQYKANYQNVNVNFSCIGIKGEIAMNAVKSCIMTS